MSDPLNSLLYEHMLMQRHVVHSTGPYGRQAHLDRSATLLLARLKAGGTDDGCAAVRGVWTRYFHRAPTAAAAQPNTDLSKRSVTPKAEQPGSINHPRRETRDLEEEFEARHTTFAAITSGWNDDDVRTFAELMRRFNEKVS